MLQEKNMGFDEKYMLIEETDAYSGREERSCSLSWATF